MHNLSSPVMMEKIYDPHTYSPFDVRKKVFVHEGLGPGALLPLLTPYITSGFDILPISTLASPNEDGGVYVKP